MTRLMFVAATALLFCTKSSEAFAPTISSATRRNIWQPLQVSNSAAFAENIEITDIPGEFSQSNSNDVVNPNVEFDLEAAEFSAFTKTAAARAALGQFGPLTDENGETTNGISSPKKLGIESEFPKRKITARVRESGTDSMSNYIKIMCNHELLNKNEEIILAREIQILLKWEAEREMLEEQLLR